MAMALCKELTGHSLPEIGVALVGVTTTVLHDAVESRAYAPPTGRIREDKAERCVLTGNVYILWVGSGQRVDKSR
jgi:hypothetical protein